MPNPEAGQYGRRYWCIGLSDQEHTEIYVYADGIESADGSLCAWRRESDGGDLVKTLGFAAGQWAFFYAASVLDGHAVAAMHWPGQIA